MADEVLERKSCQAGERFFKEGDEGNRAYVVQAGEVEIIKSTGEDEDIVLATIGKGSIFGKMALIDDKPRMASARAAKGGGDSHRRLAHDVPAEIGQDGPVYQGTPEHPLR